MKSIIFFSIIILAAGCTTEKAAVKLSPEQADKIRIAIMNWMECEECSGGELDSLVQYRQKVVRSLGAILADGPSPARRETYESQLRDAYREMVEYQKSHPENKTAGSEGEYVDTYMQNYIALYQTRAATALSVIGGEEARNILEDAGKRELRSDVKAVVQEALRKANK